MKMILSHGIGFILVTVLKTNAPSHMYSSMIEFCLTNLKCLPNKLPTFLLIDLDSHWEMIHL